MIFFPLILWIAYFALCITFSLFASERIQESKRDFGSLSRRAYITLFSLNLKYTMFSISLAPIASGYGRSFDI